MTKYLVPKENYVQPTFKKSPRCGELCECDVDCEEYKQWSMDKYEIIEIGKPK